jgi:group I intron endonuclease
MANNAPMIIYRVTNLVNDKVYIGQTRRSLSSRKSGHTHYANNGSTQYFHSALRKYGFDNFIWDVIDDTANSLEELNSLEALYIAEYNTFVDSGCGYNMTTGGDCYEMSDDTKKKIGAKAKKRLATPENNPFYGKSHTPDAILKIKNATKRQFKNGMPEETRRKLSESHKGRIQWNHNTTWEEYYKDDPDTLQRMRDEASIRTSGKNNPRYGKGDNIVGKRNPFYGRTHSDESRRQMSESKTGICTWSIDSRTKLKTTNHSKNPAERIDNYKIWYKARWKRDAPQLNIDRMLDKYNKQYREVNGK